MPPTYWALRTPRYKYIETVGTGEVEFYDLLRDPYELKSVHGDPRYSLPKQILLDDSQ